MDRQRDGWNYYVIKALHIVVQLLQVASGSEGRTSGLLQQVVYRLDVLPVAQPIASQH